jgi:hypothetical protein
VLYIGLALSFALHILLVGVASRWLEPRPAREIPTPERLPAELVEAMRAVTLSEVPDPDRETVATALPPDPRPEVAPRPPEAEPVEPRERRTAAQRLAPRVVDPRIWRPMVLLPREPNLEDVQARVAEAIEMLSDSALAEAERALRARDWTVEDASGGRWGISPGKIHLGSVTLPLPLFFPLDMEEQARQAYWRELEHQLDRAEFLESFDARVRAIRERRDRERSERRSVEGNGGR